MPKSIECQPWCEGHDEFDPSCQLKRTLYVPEDAGYEAVATSDSLQDPALNALKASMKSFGFPPAVDLVLLNAYQDEDQEQPVIDLAFWQSDDSVDEVTCSLSTSLAGLEELHRCIGEAIQALQKSA